MICTVTMLCSPGAELVKGGALLVKGRHPACPDVPSITQDEEEARRKAEQVELKDKLKARIENWRSNKKVQAMNVL